MHLHLQVQPLFGDSRVVSANFSQYQTKMECLQVATQEQLLQIAQESHVIYAGATINPWRRADDHSSDGFTGTMFFAETRNMMQAEDRLLRVRNYRHNTHQQSNADPSPGYIYVIKGRKHYY